MEGYDYDAAAATIKIIEDITTDATNQQILRWLKENDPEFDEMWMRGSRPYGAIEYCPENDRRDLGWIGYFIGESTALKKLHLSSDPFQGFSHNAVDQFCRGVNSNRSIQKIYFHSMDLLGGEIFQSLRPFFEDNNNISKLTVLGCQFGAGCARQLSLVLRGCNKSLKSITINNNQMRGEQLADIIEALSAHPQLETIELWSMNIGRNECSALSVLLRSTTELHELTLRNNDIDDEGVDDLAGVLANNNRLRSLSLSSNRITDRGCQRLATLLENPSCNLEELNLYNNNIDNEGAITFANALTTNRKLKTLYLSDDVITAEGWSSFSKVFCDTSSINKTFLSNHTLEHLGDPSRMPADVRSLLALNRCSEDKKQVAMKKMLSHHRHFDMQPFFEWELKVLPIAVNWFERARSVDRNDKARIGKHTLGAIYQFIRAMPDVFEPAPAPGGEKRKRNVVGG